MEFERTIVWGLIGIFAISFISAGIFTRTPRSRERAFMEFVGRVRLDPGSDRTRAVVQRRVSAVLMARIVGCVVGLIVAAIALLWVPEWQTPATVFFVVIPPMFLGLIFGGVVVTLRDSLFRQSPDAPRVARASSPELSDYVAPRYRVTAGVVLALAGAATAALVAVGALGYLDMATLLTLPALPTFVIALAVCFSVRLLSRRVLSQAQPAADSSELAWDDALRADTLLKLTTLAVVISWASFVASVYPLLTVTFADPASTWPGVIAAQLLTWGMLIMSFDAQFGRSQSFFLFRLWPGTDFETGVVEEAHA